MKKRVFLIIVFVSVTGLILPGCLASDRAVIFGTVTTDVQLTEDQKKLIGKEFYQTADIESENDLTPIEKINKFTLQNIEVKRIFDRDNGQSDETKYFIKSATGEIDCLTENSQDVNVIGSRYHQKFQYKYRDCSKVKISFVEITNLSLEGSSNNIEVVINFAELSGNNGAIYIPAHIKNNTSTDIKMNSVWDTLTFAVNGTSYQARLAYIDDHLSAARYPGEVLKNTGADFTIQIPVNSGGSFMLGLEGLKQMAVSAKNNTEAEQFNNLIRGKYKIYMQKVNIDLKAHFTKEKKRKVESL